MPAGVWSESIRRQMEVAYHLRARGEEKALVQCLARDMANISDAILAATLKELIADQLVAREQFNEIPPRVEYRLTEKGESVVPILQSICRWAGLYERNISAANPLPQCQQCSYGFRSDS